MVGFCSTGDFIRWCVLYNSFLCIRSHNFVLNILLSSVLNTVHCFIHLFCCYRWCCNYAACFSYRSKRNTDLGSIRYQGTPLDSFGDYERKKNYIWIVTIWDKHFIYKRNFMLNSSIHFHLFFLCSLLFHDFQLHISLIKYSFFRSLCSGIFFFSFISSLERLFIGLISQDSKWSIKYGRILNESSIWKCVSFFEWCDRKKNVFNFQEVQKKGEPTDWIDAHWIFFPNSRLHIKLLYSNFWVSASLGKWFWNWNYEFHTLFICLFFSKAKLEHCAYAVNSGFRFKNGYVVVTSILQMHLGHLFALDELQNDKQIFGGTMNLMLTQSFDHLAHSQQLVQNPFRFNPEIFKIFIPFATCVIRLWR